MSEILQIRKEFHANLCRRILGYRKADGSVNLADSSSDVSCEIAARMAKKIGPRLKQISKTGQTIGKEFGDCTRDFLEAAFSNLTHVRPGEWSFSTSQSGSGIGAYGQYRHLLDLQRILGEHPDLRTSLGGDYLITPDIIVARRPLTDEELNRDRDLVGDGIEASRTQLRQRPDGSRAPILHASVSCKWTMRSDRAQNTRTEALNLIRNRKGNTPHIVVVTFEPLPTRLASIAMGTGDIDCTYHAALDELLEAVRESGRSDQLEILQSLIEGDRLRDISDLPLDLAV